MRLLDGVCLVGLLLVGAGTLSAQNTRVIPNCSLPFTLIADGAMAQPLDNRGTGCNVWAVVFEKFGGAGAGSVTFQAARSNASGGNTGLSWATFPSAPLGSGSNPETAVFASVWFQGGAPFVRVSASGLDSTLRGTIFGWVANPGGAEAGGGGGGVTSMVDIVASIPLDVNILSPSPLPVTEAQVCTSQAAISFSGTANAQIIAASGSLTPVICMIVLTSDTSTNIGVTRGTGANCGTGTTTLLTLTSSLGAVLDYQSNRSTFAAAASNAVCINSSASATITGQVFYRYQ